MGEKFLKKRGKFLKKSGLIPEEIEAKFLKKTGKKYPKKQEKKP